MTHRFFTTGQHISASGIYRVSHSEHRVPEEMVLLKGQDFPRCGKCGDPVVFELIHPAPDIYTDLDFMVVLYELPELREISVTDYTEKQDRKKVS